MQFAMTLAWDSTTPFDSPVVPPVNNMTAGSSGDTLGSTRRFGARSVRSSLTSIVGPPPPNPRPASGGRRRFTHLAFDQHDAGAALGDRMGELGRRPSPVEHRRQTACRGDAAEGLDDEHAVAAEHGHRLPGFEPSFQEVPGECATRSASSPWVSWPRSSMTAR